MRRASVTFPAIVAVIDDAAGVGLSEKAAQQIRDVIRNLRDREQALLLTYEADSPNTQTVIAMAKELGIECRPFPSATGPRGASESGGEAARRMELLEASDLLLVLRRSTASETPAEEIDISNLAKSTGRPVIEIDPETGVQSGQIPTKLVRDTGWLAAIFDKAEVSLTNDLEEIRDSIAGLARGFKKVTRRWWVWLLLIQGLAILLPLIWLTQQWLALTWRYALIMLFSIVAMVAIAWWLRWRGMQKIWARTRLVGEIGRSMLDTQRLSRFPALRVLDAVPALRPLRWCKLPETEPITDFSKWRESYIEHRMDGQTKYFSKEQAKLERERRTLNRWAILLLDLSLAFAAFGFITVLWPYLLPLRLGVIFWTAAITSVVSAVLVQTFAAVEDLNVRIGVCARQRETIKRARTKLENIASSQLAIEIVEETEQQLLQENLDWYFRFEEAQHFCSIRGTQRTAEGVQAIPTIISEAWYFRWANAALARSSTASLFVLRVLLGRLPWAIGPAALVLLWVGLHLSNSALLEPPRLVDVSGGDWRYDPEKPDHGCVVIVHGLWGETAASVDATGKPYWTTLMARAIAKRLRYAAPNIIILDWHLAAQPSRVYGRFSQHDPMAALLDFGAIRPHAQKLGELAAIALIREKTFNKNRPLHLIGHSAGGFAVAKCALMLRDADQVPNPLQITILDTPLVFNGPMGLSWRDEDLLKKLPKAFAGKIDFYKTSDLVQLPNDFRPPEGLHYYPVPHQSEGLEKDHAYACEWYIDTIENGGKGEGFDCSPFAALAPLMQQE